MQRITLGSEVYKNLNVEISYVLEGAHASLYVLKISMGNTCDGQ